METIKELIGICGHNTIIEQDKGQWIVNCSMDGGDCCPGIGCIMGVYDKDDYSLDDVIEIVTTREKDEFYEED